MAEIQLLAGERQENESDKAAIACNDWLRMGPGRTLVGLLDKYSKTQQNTAPTHSPNTLQGWSSKFDWSTRAAEFDANWDAIRTEERAKELAYGLALDYERVRKLKHLADFLETQIYEQNDDGAFTNVWVPDVKVVGHGDAAEVVDIERFNSALFTQFRETLNDLAKEVGGRIAKSESETKLSGELGITHTLDPEQYQRAIGSLADALGTSLPDPDTDG